MKLKRFVLWIFVFVGISFMIYSCSHYNAQKKVSKSSKNGDDESHNDGQNCMNCHKTGGKGEGWFNVAGSVYKANLQNQNPNGTIYLYTEAGGKGELKYTIEVDELGNFYTTEPIDFGVGLYPVHQNSLGTKQFMESPIINGECQSCHGVNTDKIWNH